MITKFYQIMAERKRRQAVQSIRQEFAKAGFPLDRFPDAEVEAALTYANDDIASVTLTPTTIYRALRRLQRFTAPASGIPQPTPPTLAERVTR